MQMTVKWPPRSGRNRLFALWDDALNDMLAHLKLKRATLHELPPEKPTGSALTGETYALWVSATDQFQAEGTAIFDAVRPGLHANAAHLGRVHDVHDEQSLRPPGAAASNNLIRIGFCAGSTCAPTFVSCHGLPRH